METMSEGVGEMVMEEIDGSWDLSLKIDHERRKAERVQSSFFAVQRRGADEYYRLVTNISRNGFFFQDPVPAEQLGELVVMDFALPGEAQPLRVTGMVRFVGFGQGVGCEIASTRQDQYEKLLAVPPPIPSK